MTVETALAILSSATPIVVGVLAYFTARMARSTGHKLDEIHTLVNSRLTEALAKIDRLEASLFEATGEAPTGEPPRVEA